MNRIVRPHWFALALGTAWGCGGGATVDASRPDVSASDSPSDGGVAVDVTTIDSPTLDSAVDSTVADATITDGEADAGAADVAPPVDAGTDSPEGTGPHTVMRSNATVGGNAVVVFDPQLTAGQRAPVVMFKHGFQLTTANYATTLTQIASHGYIVIGVDSAGGFSGPTQAQERDGVIAAIDWALGASAPFAAHADTEHLAVMGHSRGGKIAIMVAAADARVDAVLGLDPVNGCGPGQSYSADCPDVTMGTFVPAFTIPIGLLGETADASGGFMPCAPAAQNYATIYRATMPSSWAASWTLAGAAHMTFTDDGGGFAGAFCAMATGDVMALRGEIRTLSVAFLDRHLKGDASRDPWLTGAFVPTIVTVEHH